MEPSQPKTQDLPLDVKPELSQNEIPNATGFNFGPLPVVTGTEENQEPAVEMTPVETAPVETAPVEEATFENQDLISLISQKKYMAVLFPKKQSIYDSK